MNEIFYSGLLPGTLLFSRFVLSRCLSASACGGVYLCQLYGDPGELVALKVLTLRGPKGRELPDLSRELALSSRIHHPNVLRAESVYADDEFIALVMPYIRGGTLAEILQREPFLPLVDVVSLVEQICSGLRAVHEIGIIHRDLKPENILVDGGGTVKIADFGISLDRANWDDCRESGLTGTIDYLSPEYIEGGTIDCRSDVYAVGVISYLLTTGVLPFPGESVVEALAERIEREPLSPAHYRPDCPQELSRIILRALERDPNFRYQSAEELHSDLLECKGAINSDFSAIYRGSSLKMRAA